MQSTLETERLILRLFELKDAKTVQILAGDWEIADKIPPIPHPYPDGAAEAWIEYLNKNDKEIGFAITRKSDTMLMGSISLILNKEHQKAEVGYWLGVIYWGNGYMTEACKRIIQYAFEELKLNKLTSSVMTRNPASSRVLEKCGFKKEGTLLQHILAKGKFEDIHLYGLLRTDYE